MSIYYLIRYHRIPNINTIVNNYIKIKLAEFRFLNKNTYPATATTTKKKQAK